MLKECEKKEICLFGIGQVLEDVIEEVKRFFNVTALSDNNPIFWNRYYHDIKCVPPDMLKNKLVYITVGDEELFRNISLQLQEIGSISKHISECKEIDFSFLTYGLFNKCIDVSKLSEAYTDKDYNNKIIIKGQNLIKNCEVVFSGKNNVVILEDNMICRSRLRINCFGDYNEVHIGRKVKIGRAGTNSEVSVNNGSRCLIGDGTDIQQCDIIVNEKGTVKIGEGCMLSYGIKLRQSDFHPIYDKNTNERINKSRDIIVEDEVWLGEDVMLLGGAYIGSGSIVGAKTVTSSKFSKNLLIVGSPAAVIRKDVFWKQDKLR
ncbi:MAG: acyltransferase [Anaerovoracaceae bacterium]